MADPIPWEDLGSQTGQEVVDSAEAALREGRPRVLVSRFVDAALSLGVSQSLEGSILDRARAAGIEVVRRASGGLAVLHSRGDLAWALVLPRSDPAVGEDYVHSYGRLGRGVVAGLRQTGVASVWGPSGQHDRELCLLAERGAVLWIQHRVAGGAAQHLTGKALLHHGCIALAPPARPTAQLFRRFPEELARRLVGLRELPNPPDPARLVRAVGAALADGTHA